MKVSELEAKISGHMAMPEYKAWQNAVNASKKYEE